MPRRRSNPPEPDLFALAQETPAPEPKRAAMAPVTQPTSDPATPLAALSLDDIAVMLPAWSDGELSRLRDVLDGEWQRRGLPGTAAAPPHAPTPERATTVRQRRPEALAEGLTPAQLKLIRSAAKSGVSAREIARQFGLPVAAVEHVLQAQRL